MLCEILETQLTVDMAWIAILANMAAHLDEAKAAVVCERPIHFEVRKLDMAAQL